MKLTEILIILLQGKSTKYPLQSTNKIRRLELIRLKIVLDVIQLN